MSAVTSTAFDQTLANLGISRSGVSTNPTVKTEAESQTLDQSDFLKLMTAQLRNQDPFKPVENEAMVAQMAQFSSVAGISEMNQTLKGMASRLDAANGAQALGYVGKTVLVEGDTAYPTTAGGFDSVLALDSAADDVQVSITDMAGNVLRTVSLGAQGKGDIPLSWDGTLESGESAGDGPFKISATAIRSGADSTAVPVLVWAPVTSVSIPPDGSQPLLNLAGLGQKPVTAVRQVG
jgi:flagellar basal-body rod modification protein FlgD